MANELNPILKWVASLLLVAVASFGAARLGYAEVAQKNAVQDVRITTTEHCMDKHEASATRKHDILMEQLREMTKEVAGLRAEVRAFTVTKVMSNTMGQPAGYHGD